MIKKTSKLRIILFLPGFGNGGAERVFLRLLNFLHSQGHDVDLLVAAKKGALVGKLDRDVTYLGSKYSLTSFISYARYIRRSKPDIVIATLSSAIIVSGLLKSLKIVTEHKLVCRIANVYQFPKSVHEKIRQALEGKGINASEGIIANSEATLQSVNKFINLNNKVNTSVISNPVLDDNYQEKIKNISSVKNDHREIIFIGRLVPQKQADHAIEAFAIVASKIHDAKLVVIGDGPERSALLSKVAALKLEEKVVFHRYCDDIPTLLTNASCLINTSLFEGFGNIFIEGLTYCKNLIAYDSPGGASELLNNTKAIVIDQGNIKSLANAMKDALDSEKEIINHPLAEPEFLNQYTESFIGRLYEDFIINMTNKQ